MDVLNTTASLNYTGDYNGTSTSLTTALWPDNDNATSDDLVAQLLSGDMPTSTPEDVCTVLSTNCECHSTYVFYTYEEKLILGLISLPIISFGLCANILSICIFTHRVMRNSPINWYLAILSCSDTVILLSAFFVLALPRLGEYIMAWEATSFSYVIAPYFYGLMTMAQTVSVWMTVGMSLHRYTGVCFPFQSINILRRKRVIGFILGLISFSIAFNTTRFMEVKVVNNCYRSNIGAMMPVLVPTDLRLDKMYRLIFFGWAYTIMMFVVPFSILIIVNTTVGFTIRRSNRMHTYQTSDASAKKAEAKERQTTIMLIAIVMLFLSCNTLAFVVNILENINAADELYNTLVCFNNLLVIVNASSNIFIYMLFSDKYRILLQYYFCCRCCGEHRALFNSSLDDVQTTAL
uniref:G_PROTEIN_RECEP_F1_2 domain-containing protein n=1 Tax=Panagrellus redivivus TaxID=6233 RepID=A0A7E4WA33_PANRE